MRRSILLILLAATACSREKTPSGDVANRGPAAIDVAARSVRPATKAAAGEARALVVNYFDLIERQRFAEARALWDHGGADAGGDAEALGAGFARYAEYRATVGAPTDIHTVDGQQYINVGVKVRAKQANGGKTVEQAGPVMLRRSADPKKGGIDSRQWRIWGIDIRSPH